MESRRHRSATRETPAFVPVRVLVCDDAPEAREAIRALLGNRAEIALVGEAANGEEALALACALEPDVVVMDVNMPVLDGVAATRILRELVPSVRVVGFSGCAEPEIVAAMAEAGACGFYVKGSPPEDLERAIGGAGSAAPS